MSSDQPAGDEMPESGPVLGYAGTAPPPMIVVVWCRLFALWMLANALYDGAGVVGLLAARLFRARFQSPDMFAELIPSIIPLPVFFLVAWYCWRKAPAMATRMAEGADHGDAQRGITTDELFQIFLVGIGIYLLTSGITGVTSMLLEAMVSLRNGSTQTLQISGYLFSSIIRCGIWAYG